jgi:hypothetical protein
MIEPTLAFTQTMERLDLSKPFSEEVNKVCADFMHYEFEFLETATDIRGKRVGDEGKGEREKGRRRRRWEIRRREQMERVDNTFPFSGCARRVRTLAISKRSAS